MRIANPCYAEISYHKSALNLRFSHIKPNLILFLSAVKIIGLVDLWLDTITIVPTLHGSTGRMIDY